MVTASQALAAVRLTARELSPPSPRRALAMAASIISLLAFARVACSVLEAYSQVRGERLADAELMQMCAERAGKGSADFRALCLKKRAEQASPVIFKALLRACSSALRPCRPRVRKRATSRGTAAAARPEAARPRSTTSGTMCSGTAQQTTVIF